MQTKRENQKLTCEEEGHGLASSIRTPKARTQAVIWMGHRVPDTGMLELEGPWHPMALAHNDNGKQWVELECGALTPRPLDCHVRDIYVYDTRS